MKSQPTTPLLFKQGPGVIQNLKLQPMTSDSLFVLAVALITLGGVFLYLLRVEALARKLESQVRDDELASPRSDNGAPLSGILENGASSRETTRLP